MLEKFNYYADSFLKNLDYLEIILDKLYGKVNKCN